MKFKFFYVALLVSFFSSLAFASTGTHSYSRKKVKTYYGELKVIKFNENRIDNMFLFVSDKEVYKLKVPFHFKGVAFNAVGKKVEVRAVSLGILDEKSGARQLKVKNMVQKIRRN